MNYTFLICGRRSFVYIVYKRDKKKRASLLGFHEIYCALVLVLGGSEIRKLFFESSSQTRFFGDVCVFVFFFSTKKKSLRDSMVVFSLNESTYYGNLWIMLGEDETALVVFLKNDCWFRKEKKEQYLSLSYLMQSIFWFPIFFLYELPDQPLFMKPVLVFYWLFLSFEIKYWLYYFEGTLESSMNSRVCVYDYLVCTSFTQVIIWYTRCQGVYIYLWRW